MSDDLNKIGEGDTVYLNRINGPRMLVIAVEAEGYVRTTWFNKRHDPYAGRFKVKHLHKVIPRPPAELDQNVEDMPLTLATEPTYEEHADAAD